MNIELNTSEVVILVKRMDANLFACKSSARKRKADMIVHISLIKTDVSHIAYENATICEDETNIGMSQDEFDGICQSAQIGQNPFRCSVMCANPRLNEVG